MNYQEFKGYFSKIRSATSVTGKDYCDIAINGDAIHYTRESGNRQSIDIKELFQVYNRLDFINTNILRDYITGRKFSPSLAILIESGLYDSSGSRKLSPRISDTQEPNSEEAKEVIIVEDDSTNSGTRAEGTFFAALRNLLGPEYIVAKSLGKQIKPGQVFLNSNYEKMDFPPEVNSKIREILEELDSDFEMPANNMVQHIDGLIVNHPTLGTRIVEFDEEQHFTPARLVTLRALDTETYEQLIELYTAIINNSDYFFNDVLKKHRLNLPESVEVPTWYEMKSLIQINGKHNNGYIASKTGFPYLGGRIAQRAYYDLLRDLAHLSPQNKNILKPAIRIPKFIIEAICKKEFSALSIKEIQESLIYVMEELGLELN